MKLILVRHGQTPSNVAGLLDTALPGAPLTELGHEQAAALRDTVGTEPSTLPDGRLAVFSSPALRARQTAAGIRCEPVVVDGLQEIAAGDWEMSGEEQHLIGYFEVIGRWLAGDLDTATPGAGGESGHELMARLDAAIAEVVDLVGPGHDRTAVVIAHGGVIRVWASLRAANLDDTHGADHGLPNTGVVRLLGTPGRWVCTEWRDQAFELPGPVVTGADPFADPEITPALD